MNEFWGGLFVAALMVGTLVQLWLAKRQVEHVRKHRDEIPDMFAETINRESHQKAADYSIAKARLDMVEIAMSTLVVLALTMGGVINWLISLWAELFDQLSLAHGVALCGSVAVLLALLDLPVSIYRTFVLEDRFGFNRVTPRLFIIDLLKQAAVASIFGIPFLVIVLWLMGRMGGLWWLYVWIVWAAFNLLMLFLFPTFIAPLFKTFAALKDSELTGRIDALLQRCGFQARGLYVMDGSKRSSHGNAYFTGFGPAKRIVFFDTLLARLLPSEVEAVLAHELGHLKLHHIWKRVTLLLAASLALLWGLDLLINKPWFYEGLGVSSRTPAVALLLFTLIMPVFTFFLHPLASWYSRRHEFEADAYASAHATAADLQSALVKLYKDNATTLTPDPLHSAFYDSHPPASTRIACLRTS
ncbi:MAG TPA: M48 family metallopeptidase [Terrimicrobiaceae bacterium]